MEPITNLICFFLLSYLHHRSVKRSHANLKRWSKSWAALWCFICILYGLVWRKDLPCSWSQRCCNPRASIEKSRRSWWPRRTISQIEQVWSPFFLLLVSRFCFLNGKLFLCKALNAESSLPHVFQRKSAQLHAGVKSLHLQHNASLWHPRWILPSAERHIFAHVVRCELDRLTVTWTLLCKVAIVMNTKFTRCITSIFKSPSQFVTLSGNCSLLITLHPDLLNQCRFPQDCWSESLLFWYLILPEIEMKWPLWTQLPQDFSPSCSFWLWPCFGTF